MSRRGAVLLLLGLWAGTIALSFAHAWMTPPSGDGFTKGLNRLAIFLGWQAAAGLLALFLAAYSRPLPKGALRWLALLPAAVVAALVMGIAGLTLWVRLDTPP